MSLTITAALPKGYQARQMYLYVTRTRRRWGLWFSDAKGYSVPAIIGNGNPGSDCMMRDYFTTRAAAVAFTQGQGWQVWPRSITRGVPRMTDRKDEGTAATRASVTSLWIEPRKETSTDEQ